MRAASHVKVARFLDAASIVEVDRFGPAVS